MSHQPSVYGNWRHSGTQTLSLNTRVQVLCDATGAGGNAAELPGLWNPTTNRLGGSGMSGLMVDDLLTVRLSVVATLASLLTLSINPQLILDMDISAANDGLNPITADQKLLSINTGQQLLTYAFPLYVGPTFLANGLALNLKCAVPGVSLATTCTISKASIVVIKHPRA